LRVSVEKGPFKKHTGLNTTRARNQSLKGGESREVIERVAKRPKDAAVKTGKRSVV